MNPDVIFIVGMVVLIASGFVVYKIVSRARAKKLRAEYAARWERDQEQARQARNMILDRDAALVARRIEARKVAEAYRTPTHMMANNSIATSSVSAPAQQSSSMLRDAADIAVIANTFRHWNDNETPRHHSSSRDTTETTPAYVSSVTSSDDSSPSRSSYSSPSYSDDSSSSSSYSDSGSSSSSFD